MIKQKNNEQENRPEAQLTAYLQKYPYSTLPFSTDWTLSNDFQMTKLLGIRNVRMQCHGFGRERPKRKTREELCLISTNRLANTSN